MRQHTIDPLTIKAGDAVYILAMKQNFLSTGGPSGFIPSMQVCRFYVSEVIQNIASVDIKLNTRNFHFTLLSSAGSIFGATPMKFIVNERTPMFRTMKDLRAWFTEYTNAVFKSTVDHENRQEDYRIFKLEDKRLA